MRTSNDIILENLLRRLTRRGHVVIDTVECIDDDKFDHIIELDGLPISHKKIFKVIVISEEDSDDGYYIDIVVRDMYFVLVGYNVYEIKNTIIPIDYEYYENNRERYMSAIKYAKRNISPMINEFNYIRTINTNTLPYVIKIS